MATPINYCEWDWHIVDPSYADDGFGNMMLTDIDQFFHNAEQIDIWQRNVI